MADNADPAAPAVGHDFARSKDTIRLLMDDGTIFTIDRAAFDFMSREFHGMMEALDSDQPICPMPHDNPVSWRIALDIFYERERKYEAATHAELMKDMLLCDKHHMAAIRDRLACILQQQFDKCDATQLANILRLSHSPARRAYDRLFEWETKSYVSPTQIFKLGVSENLAQYSREVESRKRQDARDELERLVAIMLEQDIASCQKSGVHGSMGVSMAHTMWRRAISDVRNAQKRLRSAPLVEPRFRWSHQVLSRARMPHMQGQTKQRVQPGYW